MFNIPTIISLLEVVLVLVPALLAVAYVRGGGKKSLASTWRRLDKIVMCCWGLLHCLVVFIKLWLDWFVATKPTNMFLFFGGPEIFVLVLFLRFCVVVRSYVLGLFVKFIKPGVFDFLHGRKQAKFYVNTSKRLSGVRDYIEFFRHRRGPFNSAILGYRVRNYPYIGSLRFTSSLPSIAGSDSIKPWFMTGFCDAEACFNLTVKNSKSTRTGWHIIPLFQIGLHLKDIDLLKEIQAFFESSLLVSSGSTSKVGVIRVSGNLAYYSVFSVKELTIIIEHFDNYPLLSKKRLDYLIWKEAVLSLRRKEHLKASGLRAIVLLKAALNHGLSENLQTAFQITSTEVKGGFENKAAVLGQEEIAINPQWLAGFTSGDGNFTIGLHSNTVNLGLTPRLIFQLTQDSRDVELLIRLSTWLGCGAVRKGSQSVSIFSIQKFSDIDSKIIPLFRDNRIRGVKAYDFNDWCNGAEIIRSKGHLTKEGLDKIVALKAGMNKYRINVS